MVRFWGIPMTITSPSSLYTYALSGSVGAAGLLSATTDSLFSAVMRLFASPTPSPAWPAAAGDLAGVVGLSHRDLPFPKRLVAFIFIWTGFAPVDRFAEAAAAYEAVLEISKENGKRQASKPTSEKKKGGGGGRETHKEAAWRAQRDREEEYESSHMHNY